MSFQAREKVMSDPLSHAIQIEREFEMLAGSGTELIVAEGKPVLVLALSHPPRGQLKRPMTSVYHQCGGISCNHMTMLALPLTPRPRMLAAMQLIEKHWFDSCMGVFRTTLDEIMIYRSQLKTLVHPDADCNDTYSDLQEAVYPIDVDMRVIRELCEDDLPDNLDDLIQFDSDLQRALGMVGRWKCYILTENSD